MKYNTGKYLLYLEPSVFVFKRRSRILLYDSESSKKVIFDLTEPLKEIIDNLSNINNMYCVVLDDEALYDESVRAFVALLRDHYMADVIPNTIMPPIVIPPIMKCHADKSKEDIMHMQGTDVMQILNEITFHLNGECHQQCEFCLDYYKQFNCCYKDKGELPIKDVIKIIDNVIYGSISNKINFSGGNIFLYSKIEELFEYIRKTKIKSNLYFNYLNWNERYKEAIIDENFILHIYISAPINKEQIKSIIDSFKQKTDCLNFSFILRSEQELSFIYDIIDIFNIQQYTMLPFYDYNNIDFFRRMVYTDEKELISVTPTKRDIYKRQHVNLFDLGKLILSSSGKYYSNINFTPLGNISDDIIQIVGKEWMVGKSWKRIRSGFPCCDCIYQYLCPSPSNYELVIGQNNLCNVVFV